MKSILSSIRLLIVMIILTGVIYPLVVTLAGQALWPSQANGSLVKVNGRVVGSELLAQPFADPKYFWPRPSAADYQTVASGASNASMTSAALRETVDVRRTRFAAAHAIQDKDVPPEMMYASGSGLDPHISPDAALLQMTRVADARGFDLRKRDQLKTLIHDLTEGPQMGFLGTQRINVLLLNIRLDLL